MSFEAAERVIRFLDRRGGFDAWWEDIDRDTRQEIKEGLAELLSESRGEIRASERQGGPVLAERWRSNAAQLRLEGGDYRYYETLEECADELDALTPSQPAPSTDAAMARWIPFEATDDSRCPISGNPVQFVTFNGTTVGHRNDDGTWHDALDIGQDGTPNHDYRDEQVTHWAPLLSPPTAPKPPEQP